jgi:hypothetical protein
MTPPSNDEMEIAGKRTVADWNRLKAELGNSPNLWKTAFDDFFYSRLKTRYLNPIHLLQTCRENTGEGFSIVSLQCALIEFLQTTRDGTNFKNRCGEYKPETGKYEYASSSRCIFTKFLKEQEPFKSNFGIKLAEGFYSNVRCSLLHEARTTGSWRITANSERSETIKKEDGVTFLQRDLFQQDLETYIRKYMIELQSDTALQEAFIRKFDALCKQ